MRLCRICSTELEDWETDDICQNCQNNIISSEYVIGF